MESKQKKRTYPKDKSKKKKVLASSNIISLASKRMFGAAGANSVIKIQRTAYPVPDCLITKLKTSGVLSGTTGASGAFNSFALAPNSAYDPFASNGSFQPRYFDQLMALYNKYTVYGVKIKLKPLQRSLATSLRILAMPSTSSSPPITSCYSDGRELPYQICFDNYGSAGSQFGGLVDAQEKSIYFDVAQFFGRDRQGLMDENDYSGSASANPTNLLYYHICMQELAATNTVTASVEVIMTQYVSLREIGIPAAS